MEDRERKTSKEKSRLTVLMHAMPVDGSAIDQVVGDMDNNPVTSVGLDKGTREHS